MGRVLFMGHAWFFLLDGMSIGCMGLLGRAWGARLMTER